MKIKQSIRSQFGKTTEYHKRLELDLCVNFGSFHINFLATDNSSKKCRLKKDYLDRFDDFMSRKILVAPII